MTSISKAVYIDILDDIVNEYSNTYHRTIKLELLDVNLNTYIDFGVGNKEKKTLIWSWWSCTNTEI